MAQTLRAMSRGWSAEEDQVLREERTSGPRNKWARRAAARLPGRTPDQCWSREKTMRDRENLGPHEVHRPWATNTVSEDDHLDQLIEAGGFPQWKEIPGKRQGQHVLLPILLDPWGYKWNPA